MRGDIYLSSKEARRIHVLDQLVAGKLTVPEAARLLDLSDRQVQRLKGGYLRSGVASLVHKNRGRKPSHAIPEPVRKLILDRALHLYRETSCEHIAELLEEHDGIVLSSKSVARILRSAGIPLRFARKQSRRRRSRDRMPQFGLLLQVDASPFAWLEDRGPVLHLHGAIDDATGKIVGLQFELEECTAGYLRVLDQTIRRHGVPNSLYTDLRSVFFSPKADKLSVAEELAGIQASLTQFGRALNQLGITHIPARSPQAKGRVERLWGTLQARLVVEMRIAGITSLEAANLFLPGFIERFNVRFAVDPIGPKSAFQAAPPADQLETIIAWHHDRKASNGSTISFENQPYQLIAQSGQAMPLRPRSTVTIVQKLDGGLLALYNGVTYSLRRFTAPPKAAPAPKSAPAQSAARKPAESHPWNQPFSKKRIAQLRPPQRSDVEPATAQG